ncbi:MAG: ABC transporter permease subunit [Candidatus Kariarchaeum pelagius]
MQSSLDKNIKETQVNLSLLETNEYSTYLSKRLNVPNSRLRSLRQKFSIFNLNLFASISIIVLISTVIVMITYSSRIYANPSILIDIFTNTKFDPGELFDEGDWGIWPMIYGTFAVGIPALLLSIYWGLGIAIYLSEYVNNKWSRRLQSIIEFFAAMPSVVLGLIAVRYISDLTKFIFQRTWFIEFTSFLGFNEGNGIVVNSSNIILNAALAIAVMATPTIASISLDAMKLTPSAQRYAVRSLGGTQKEVYDTVVYPHSQKTIFASVLLAFGRIIGETMIVTVALGSNAYIGLQMIFGFIPFPNLWVNGITLTSLITTYFGEASAQSDIRQYLFLAGAILLLFSFVIIWLSSLLINNNKYMMKIIDIFYLPFSYLSKLLSNIIEKYKKSIDFSDNLTMTLIDKRNSSNRRFYYKNFFKLMSYVLFSIGIIYMMTREGLNFLSDGEGLIQGVINFFNFIITKPVLSVMQRGMYGAYPSLIGSTLLVLMASLIAFPFGTTTGIFLYEFSNNNKYSQIIQQTIINISAIPSIVVGLFAYATFVVAAGYGQGLLSGGFALAIMMIPVVTTNTIEALRNIPMDHKNSALALGVTKWEAFKHHRLPYAFPSIITGYILGIARVIGETAPILFTIASITNTIIPDSLTNQPLRILTYEIFFNLTLQTRQVDGYRIGPIWASVLAMVLIFFVGILNILAFVIRKILRARYEYNGNI